MAIQNFIMNSLTSHATDHQAEFTRSDSDLTAAFQRGMDEATQQALAARDKAVQQTERLGARKDLSDTARKAEAARIYKRTRAAMQEAAEARVKAVEDHKRKLVHKAFGSEKARTPEDARAWREATRAANEAPNAAVATDMVAEAMFAGDHTTAQAIAAVAFERSSLDPSWSGVVDAWNADGRNDRAVSYLREMRELPNTGDVAWRMQNAAPFHYDKPDVLEGLRDWEIDHLAREGEGPEAA